MFLGYGWACIQLRPGHAWAPLRCSCGTSNLGVDAGLRGRLSSSLHADGFEGWCSPRCFGPRTASGSCCGDGGLSLVRVSGLRGACRPSSAHEDSRPVALKTDVAYTKMDQPPRQTNGRTVYQSDSVNQVLPSKTQQVDSKRDYGPLVQTTLTLKKILHRVVKLILQDFIIQDICMRSVHHRLAGLRFCSPTFLLIILLINVTVSVCVLPSSAS